MGKMNNSFFFILSVYNRPSFCSNAFCIPFIVNNENIISIAKMPYKIFKNTKIFNSLTCKLKLINSIFKLKNKTRHFRHLYTFYT